MSGPIDPASRIGRRFGKFAIIGVAGNGVLGGRSAPVYRCKCDCGNQQDVIYTQLMSGRVQACDTCRFTRECTVCGKEFFSRQYKTVCSPECRKEYMRRHHLESYYRRSAHDPEFNRRRNQRKRELLAADPERAALHRQREIERSRRRRASMTEEELEADRERRRRYYRENAAEIQRVRRERFLAKPPAERARIYARWLQNHRDWYDRHRDERREQRRIMFEADPEGWRAYKRERRRLQAEKRAQAELAELTKALQNKLTNRD